MDNTIQKTLAELKQGGRLVNRMNGNIFLTPANGVIRRVSRTTLASLKQQGLVQRTNNPSNPFVRTYELSPQSHD